MEISPESKNATEQVTTTTAPHDTQKTPEKKEGFLSEIIRFSLVALLIVLPIRLFIAQPFIVSGASMETTFSTGQYLIVDQLTYHLEDPVRGEVIVFRYPKDPSKFFIKRIIGIPGDTISISGRSVTISNAAHPDGILLDESYVLDMKPSAAITEVLGTDEYFVMGDNRDASSDSRAWGVLLRAQIGGRALPRRCPISRGDDIPGQHYINL